MTIVRNTNALREVQDHLCLEQAVYIVISVSQKGILLYTCKDHNNKFNRLLREVQETEQMDSQKVNVLEDKPIRVEDAVMCSQHD